MTAPRPLPLMPAERPKVRYIAALYALYDEYCAEIEASGLSPASQHDYAYFVELFLHWLHNDYTPGQGIG